MKYFKDKTLEEGIRELMMLSTGSRRLKEERTLIIDLALVKQVIDRPSHCNARQSKSGKGKNFSTNILI